MIPRDVYQMKAADLFAKAAAERDSAVKADFERIGRGYRRLADQAKRNAQNDIVLGNTASAKETQSVNSRKDLCRVKGREPGCNLLLQEGACGERTRARNQISRRSNILLRSRSALAETRREL